MCEIYQPNLDRRKCQTKGQLDTICSGFWRVPTREHSSSRSLSSPSSESTCSACCRQLAALLTRRPSSQSSVSPVSWVVVGEEMSALPPCCPWQSRIVRTVLRGTHDAQSPLRHVKADHSILEMILRPIYNVHHICAYSYIVCI